jgi:hypothetical protein
MKEILAILAFGCAAIPAAQAQFQPSHLIPETLRYRMLTGSAEVGSSTTTISRDEAAGTIHIVESISGLFEQTAAVTLRDNTTLQTLASHVVSWRNHQYQQVRLQYLNDGQRVTGEVCRPPEFITPREVDIAFAPGTADIYAVPHLFRAASLAVGRTIRFSHFNALQNESGPARAWVARREIVAVPAGSFECHRLEAHAGSARLILFIDTRFPHRIIEQILPAIDVKLELVAIE